MDLTRSCYTTNAYMFRDGTNLPPGLGGAGDVECGLTTGKVVSRLRWFFAKDGAKVFPGPHLFRCENWATDRLSWPGLGEILPQPEGFENQQQAWNRERPWVNGRPPQQAGELPACCGPGLAEGQNPCGTLSYFTVGIPPPLGSMLTTGIGPPIEVECLLGAPSRPSDVECDLSEKLFSTPCYPPGLPASLKWTFHCPPGSSRPDLDGYSRTLVFGQPISLHAWSFLDASAVYLVELAFGCTFGGWLAGGFASGILLPIFLTNTLVHTGGSFPVTFGNVFPGDSITTVSIDFP